MNIVSDLSPDQDIIVGLCVCIVRLPVAVNLDAHVKNVQENVWVGAEGWGD